MEKRTKEYTIKKADSELQVAFGEVYSPSFPDSQGDFMEAEDIVLSAYKFMNDLQLRKIDVNHDGNTDGIGVVVESFIARKGDPDFVPGSWVVGVRVHDEEIWEKIKGGEINGFSMEAMVKQRKKLLTVEIPEILKGDTESQEEHTHSFELKLDSRGKVLSGSTSVNDGHFHEIRRGTATEKADGHSHRYSFKELINVPEPEDNEIIT
jgi:hypothetical protein